MWLGGRGTGTCGTSLPPSSRSSKPDAFFFFFYFLLFLFLSVISPQFFSLRCSTRLRGTLLFCAGSDHAVSAPRRGISPRVRDTGKAPLPVPAGRTRPGCLHPRGQKNRGGEGEISPPVFPRYRGKTGVSAGTAALPEGCTPAPGTDTDTSGIAYAGKDRDDGPRDASRGGCRAPGAVSSLRRRCPSPGRRGQERECAWVRVRVCVPGPALL